MRGCQEADVWTKWFCWPLRSSTHCTNRCPPRSRVKSSHHTKPMESTMVGSGMGCAGAAGSSCRPNVGNDCSIMLVLAFGVHGRTV